MVKFEAPALGRRTTFRLMDARQLSTPESVTWLDMDRLPSGTLEEVPTGDMQAVNVRHPRWRDACTFTAVKPGKKRVHLLAVGDVGGILLTGLKLLGGDCIETIGICDLNAGAVARWTAEMAQVSWPGEYSALPEVVSVTQEQLFDCDVFLFAATKGIPPVGSEVADVRMAQLAANRPIVEGYARAARTAHFNGLFVVLSDPVDPLCQAAYTASNLGTDGVWDGQGLLAEQVQGFGLGVMNARAAALAKEDARFADFLKDGRSFGPHGEGLVIANSLTHYDDALSRELTDRVRTANLRIRELGYKPYVAPALSSGAIQLLLTLRGAWHYGSVCLGGIWFGCWNRYTRYGQETESRRLPDALFGRLLETEALLHSLCGTGDEAGV